MQDYRTHADMDTGMAGSNRKVILDTFTSFVISTSTLDAEQVNGAVLVGMGDFHISL